MLLVEHVSRTMGEAEHFEDPAVGRAERAPVAAGVVGPGKQPLGRSSDRPSESRLRWFGDAA